MTDELIPLRGGVLTTDRRLDRVASATDEHLRKYPLTLATMPDAHVPVPIGVNWYSAFDAPVQRKIGRKTWWVIGDGDLGRVRGGHCVCLRPWGVVDAAGWWPYYDQGVEGRCVEFGVSRMLSLLNRKRYDIQSRWLYWTAQSLDEWEGGSYPGASPAYEGTSVRAALEVVRSQGAFPARTRSQAPSPADGISAYRWAQSWDDVRQVLGVPADLPGVPMLNSWGRSYPREVLLMDAAGARLLAEDGEMGVVTDL